MSVILAVLLLVAATVADLRWLRVAQREHYAPGRVTVFAARWFTLGAGNRSAAVVGALAAVATLAPGVPAWVGAVACLVVAVAPLELGVRGRTAPLVWSRRLRVLAGLVAALLLVSAAVVLVVPASLGLLALVQPLVVDAALAITAPLERLASQKWVRQARERLDRVGPAVVGITGSYGKTTVKNYVHHLVSTRHTTIASRKSFNNRLGLARSINTDLAPGTEVFIAEMGTYGPGEIADLCSWCPPDVAAITAIGPVHLERMGSLDTIVRAKSEILVDAEFAVLNVDDERLAALADEVEADGRRVLRCGSATAASSLDVRVTPDEAVLRVTVAGRDEVVVDRPAGAVVATNVAVAIGVCVGLDALPPNLTATLASLPEVENRLTTSETADGPTILDDTYNANPAGAGVALERLAALAGDRPDGRAIVVTPGMVELGPRQHEANAAFAERAGRIGADLVVVGRTNAAALAAGHARAGGGQLVQVRDRGAAVEWLRDHAGPGDVVLFENDLPDHFP